MQITSGINAVALLSFMTAFMLASNGAHAQEPIAPATAAPVVDTVSPGYTNSASATPVSPNSVSANSKIRIVRLSEVRGDVKLDRQTGRGFEAAMANLPVVEGERLKTGIGIAEIELEDNSTIRVADNSVVEFPRLELLPSGAKASTLTVLQGTVYVSLIDTKGNEFAVNAGRQTISLPPDSHIRLQLTGDQASLAVMHGEALLAEGTTNTSVGKNKTMTFSLAQQSDPVIARSVAEDPLDGWDKDAVKYHKSFANATSFGNSPYSYGLSDLNYYGSFGNFGGCGSMWRPYFAGAGWDPYGSGAWAYYPTAGYSWVSPYPWGWTPYHSGSWAFCQGVGWGWQPNASWYGLNNYARATSGTSFKHPLPPTRPPVAAESTLLPVNLKALPTSTLGKNETFVFRQDSAGFGVPRGNLGKLNSFSHETAQHGAATTSINYNGGDARGSVAQGAAMSPASSRPSSVGAQSSVSAPGGSHASGGGGAGHH